MKAKPPTVLAYVGTEGHYRPVLDHASEAARQSGARLILYDIDAANSLASPRPTVWSADGADRPFEDGVLTPEMLRATGQVELADLVEDCRQEGIDAFGWLPVNVKVDSLLEYADERGADLIVVPADHARHSLGDLLTGKKVEHLDEETARTVAVVADDGSVELH